LVEEYTMFGVSHDVAKLRADVLSAENLEWLGHIFDFATLLLKCCRQHFTGENPPYGIPGKAMETLASYEARSAPSLYPTAGPIRTWKKEETASDLSSILCDASPRFQ
jgi:hypothetical protein